MSQTFDIDTPLRYSDERKRPKTPEQRAIISAGVRRALAEGRGRRGDADPEIVAKRKRNHSLVKVQQQCERIIEYWATRGYHAIIAKPREVQMGPNTKLNGGNIIWEIETNIGPDGYPPKV
jgi:hypothetical protein